jgi:hypothetical protein
MSGGRLGLPIEAALPRMAIRARCRRSAAHLHRWWRRQMHPLRLLPLGVGRRQDANARRLQCLRAAGSGGLRRRGPGASADAAELQLVDGADALFQVFRPSGKAHCRHRAPAIDRINFAAEFAEAVHPARRFERTAAQSPRPRRVSRARNLAREFSGLDGAGRTRRQRFCSAPAQRRRRRSDCQRRDTRRR